jgi:hypothetical protein
LDVIAKTLYCYLYAALTLHPADPRTDRQSADRTASAPVTTTAFRSLQRPGALSFFQGPYDAALLDWDTLSSIGPVSGEGFGDSTFWQVPLVTDYGTLELMADGPAIFTAFVVQSPLPPS